MILMVFLIFSCQEVEKMKKPDDLIPEQKMVEVLTDLSLINSAKNYNKRFLEEKGVKPEEYVYERHNIDSTRLAESTRYYAQNYDDFERIYTRVKVNLEEMKAELDIRMEEENRVKDSIRTLEKIDTLEPGSEPEKIVKDTIIDSLQVNRRIRQQ